MPKIPGMATFKKDPQAALDYKFDWTDYLTPLPDTIIAVAWVLSAGLAKVSESFAPNVATIFVSGGVLDGTETITCRITTAGGRTDDRTIHLRITNR